MVPALQSVFGDSGGLILNQTYVPSSEFIHRTFLLFLCFVFTSLICRVDDWVFNCNYFLINLLLPVPPSCSLLLNGSNFNTATILSGKNNISEVYIVERGGKKIWEEREWRSEPTIS